MSIFRDSTFSSLERQFTHKNGTPTTAPPIKETPHEATIHKNSDQQKRPLSDGQNQEK